MASVKRAYGSSVDHTITLASLASSSTLVAGRAGTAIDETTNMYIDELLAGYVTTCGTVNPTAGTEIDIYVYGSFNDTPEYPGYATATGVTGTDAAFTFDNANQMNSGLKLVASLYVPATQSYRIPFGPISVASLFDGVLPKKWGVYVTQNSGQILHATSGNHKISSTGVYETVV